MKSGFQLIAAMLVGATISARGFNLDIASTEVTEFGRGPLSITVPGYGEVTFESDLDGSLVVDPGYASTGKMVVPPAATSASESPVAATEETGYVTISSRTTASGTDQPVSDDKRVTEGEQSEPKAVNSVPESASAALGLLGILMLLLRRWR